MGFKSTITGLIGVGTIGLIGYQSFQNGKTKSEQTINAYNLAEPKDIYQSDSIGMQKLNKNKENFDKFCDSNASFCSCFFEKTVENIVPVLLGAVSIVARKNFIGKAAIFGLIGYLGYKLLNQTGYLNKVYPEAQMQNNTLANQSIAASPLITNAYIPYQDCYQPVMPTQSYYYNPYAMYY